MQGAATVMLEPIEYHLQTDNTIYHILQVKAMSSSIRIFIPSLNQTSPCGFFSNVSYLSRQIFILSNDMVKESSLPTIHRAMFTKPEA